jgi:hypothetical protein
VVGAELTGPLLLAAAADETVAGLLAALLAGVLAALLAAGAVAAAELAGALAVPLLLEQAAVRAIVAATVRTRPLRRESKVGIRGSLEWRGDNIYHKYILDKCRRRSYPTCRVS